MPNEYYDVERITLPLIPLRGISIFPYMVIHFDIGRDKSIKALEKAMLNDSIIMLCSQIDPRVDEPTEEDFYHIGTIAKVRQMLKLPGDSIRVLVEGVNRGRVINILEDDEYYEVEVDSLVYNPDKVFKDKALEAAMRLVINDLEEYIELSSKISPEPSYGGC